MLGVIVAAPSLLAAFQNPVKNKTKTLEFTNNLKRSRMCPAHNIINLHLRFMNFITFGYILDTILHCITRLT